MKDLHTQIFNCQNRDDKKQLLKAISIKAKEVIKLVDDSKTVNQILIDWYTNETHKEFHSFWDWKKLGFKVKKGEKAFFVWSKKRETKKENEKGEEEEFSFFSLAYLFSNAQVEPLKKSAEC